ncbi:MAG: hypothetical protein KAF91_23950 [Nostoc sp. TH1S01]|nr:hypothetical protein [Nostoc sp. TH1S01]
MVIRMNIAIGSIFSSIWTLGQFILWLWKNLPNFGVIVAIAGAWFQIHRFYTEKQDFKRATISSSLLDLKGKLRTIVYKTERNVLADWMDIAIGATNEVRNYLHDIKCKKELINFLEEGNVDSKNKILDISRVMSTGICKSKIRNKPIEEVKDLTVLLFRYEVDMPLTIEVIRDSLYFISIAMILPIDSAPYDQSFTEDFIGYVKNLKSENIDMVYRNITIKIFEHINDQFYKIGHPTLMAASKIINILINHISSKSNKELMELQKWEKIFLKKNSHQMKINLMKIYLKN